MATQISKTKAFTLAQSAISAVCGGEMPRWMEPASEDLDGPKRVLWAATYEEALIERRDAVVILALRFMGIDARLADCVLSDVGGNCFFGTARELFNAAVTELSGDAEESSSPSLPVIATGHSVSRPSCHSLEKKH